jgi:hypothetical protein
VIAGVLHSAGGRNYLSSSFIELLSPSSRLLFDLLPALLPDLLLELLRSPARLPELPLLAPLRPLELLLPPLLPLPFVAIVVWFKGFHPWFKAYAGFRDTVDQHG